MEFEQCDLVCVYVIQTAVFVDYVIKVVLLALRARQSSVIIFRSELLQAQAYTNKRPTNYFVIQATGSNTNIRETNATHIVSCFCLAPTAG